MDFFSSLRTDVGISSIAWPLMQQFCHALRHNSIMSQGGATDVFWKDYREKVEVSKPPCQSSLHRAPPHPHPLPTILTQPIHAAIGVEGAWKI